MNMSARRIGAVILGVGASTLVAAIAFASPAAADNGPHISIGADAVIGAGPDGCADCHRIHMAQGGGSGSSGGMLFKNEGTGAEFCETCHGSAGSGATTNVVDGKSTASGATADSKGLRGGGFEYAWLDTDNATAGPTYWNTTRSAWSTSKFGDPALGVGSSSVPVRTTAQAVTSTHSLEVSSTMWGSGISGKGATGVTLECTSCHNPHGNGNFRILRPLGTPIGTITADYAGGQIVGQFVTVTAGVATADPNYSGKYRLTFTAAGMTFRPGQLVNVWSAGGTPTKLISRTLIAEVKTTATAQFTVTNQSLPSGWTADVEKDLTGTAMYAAPATGSNIAKAVTDGTNIVYTMTDYGSSGNNHGLFVGQKVTIKSATTGYSAYTVEQGTITAATNNTFTIASTTAAATVGIEGALYIVGIPDAKAADSATLGVGIPVGTTGYKKVYTTNDYFRADDHYYTGEFQSNVSYTDQSGATIAYAGLKTGYIVNVSEWCATCHTRYLANSSSRSNPSVINGTVDTFKYRHTSMSKQESSQNCMACHVSHGTNASMNGAYSSGLTTPDGVVPSARAEDGTTHLETANGTSRLLRANNRGVCLLCHKAAVTTG